MSYRRCQEYFSPNGVMKNVFIIITLLSFSFLVAVANARKLAESGVDDQVASLIAFKKSSVESDPNKFLDDWTSSSSSPCTWNGISCSNGQVVEVNLSSAGLTGPLHLTNLMALPTLLRVSFNGNHFYGNLSSTAASCSFEFLDLSANNFSETLVLEPLLKSCDKIKHLNVSRNSIKGVALKFGPSLLQLDLSNNTISDFGILSYTLSNCQNLNLLNFSSNKLAGKLNSSLSSCKSLSVLDLSSNNLTEELNDLDFGTCQNLTVLNLSFNNLSSTELPPSLANCQSLNTLDIGHNSIRMEIPGELLVNLKSLKRLVLAHNQFFGKIPSELGKTCSTLEELNLSGNRLTGELPSTFKLCSSLISLNLGNNELSGDFLNTVISSIPNLRYLYLSFNNITGHVPRSLVNCTKLQVLDLSSNAFVGNVPYEFCLADSGFPLETMLLAGNFLTGTVPKQLGLCRNLRKIDLSFNLLSGSIPQEIWTLPNLSELVMWANNLTGGIPEGICINGGNLQTLILNNNFLTGALPQSIANCTNLVWVSLSSNRLSGEIPRGIGNLANLAILQLGNNSLTGLIPRELGMCRSLIWLDLNSNALTGSIPPELADQAGLVNPGTVSGIKFAFVRNEGGTECRGAGGLVEFEGIREERLEILPMVHSCPSTRIYSGKTMYTFKSNGSMIFVDLSYNSLSGIIPDKLGSLSSIQVLNLGHNNFSGAIPFSFGGMKIVGVLDLSHNSLQGFIPSSLGGLSFLSDLDVSNNNLSGMIPSGGQLTTFPASRYENNSGLCGVPLPPCSPGNGHHSLIIHHHGNKTPTTIGAVAGIMVSFLCIILLVTALYRIKRTQREQEKRDKYIDSLPTSGGSSWKISTVPEPLSINIATFDKPLKKLTFGHLLEATNGFSSESLIGSGGFGEVYKAQLRDGNTVAIKKLVHVTSQGDREFMAEMETIGKIKHRNLVPLLGYCKIGEERLLVYEYMKWGSLESVLHDGKKGGVFLDWEARKKIAIGAARGLAFLHHSCLPHIIHRDMKSSNVLIDENFEARVSDFGMARLVNALDTHLSVSTLAGTPGYVPPEYYQSFRCTSKGDVYSYGVILLELLSGKRPIDPREFGDDNNLVGWAKQLHNEKRSHVILDPDLVTNLSGDAELYHYLKVAFDCLDEKSYKRPTMVQVMTKFKELQGDSEIDILDGISVKGSILEESQEREP